MRAKLSERWLRPRSGTVDARHAAAVLLGALPFLVGGLDDEDSVVSIVVSTVFASAVTAILGFYFLPKWRDPRHPPWTGAVAIGTAAVGAAVLVWLLF